VLANLKRLSRHRTLIQTMVSRELKARYRGSFLGYFWSLLNPLLLLLVYTVVFTYIIKAKFGEVDNYPLFLFCGILPWTWFSSSLIESSTVIISGGGLLKKILFPAEVLPVVTVLANLVHFLLALPVLLACMLFFGVTPGLHTLWFFPVVLIQFFFTMGLVLLISSLSVHFRDLKDILANLLTLWFFASPVIYPYSFVAGLPPFLRVALEVNPMTHLMMGYQGAFLFPGEIHYQRLAVMALLALLVFAFGYWVFDRLRDTLVEEV